MTSNLSDLEDPGFEPKVEVADEDLPDALPSPLDATKVLDFFPYPSYRPGQREALIEAAKAIVDGKDVLIEAPVGAGKSVIAVTLARWANTSMITTPINSLVDQYDDEFEGQFADLSVIKGRANYPCHENGLFADTGPCRTKGMAVCSCPYADARRNAVSTPSSITNLALAMTARWMDITNPKRLFFRDEPRDLLIVDEAHNLETAVASQVQIGFRFEDFVPPPPRSEKWSDHLKWIKKEGLLMARLKLGQARSEAEMAEAEYSAESNPAPHIVARHHNAIKAVDRAESLVRNMVVITEDESGEPWVPQLVADRDNKDRIERVVYRPITGARFVKKKVLFHAKRVVMLSATPPNPKDVGLDPKNIVTIRVPMNFPVERRPIIADYAGKMSMASRDGTMPVAAAKIKANMAGATIVHCHSYSIARAIDVQLTSLGVKTILQDNQDREGSLEEWMLNPHRVFLSVAMNEGLNLKDDLCRTQVLAKLPFPDLGDPWVKARNALLGEDWMKRAVATAVIQAYGRAVRSETDWANFVIVDSSFSMFYKFNIDLFPIWFREAFGLPKFDPSNPSPVKVAKRFGLGIG